MKQQLFRFAAVAALAAGMTVAQTPPAGTQRAPGKAPFSHPGGGHQQMMQALALTTTQQQQAKSIFADAKQQAQPIREQLRQNREALHAAVKANNTSEIERISTQQGELKGKALAIRSQAMAKFYAILTPEQRTKMDQMHQRMMQRMRERMQERETEDDK
jgi:Spy/CpxP family protein refolding chaperone